MIGEHVVCCTFSVQLSLRGQAAHQACKAAGLLFALCLAESIGAIAIPWLITAAGAVYLVLILVWHICYTSWTKAKSERSLQGQAGDASRKRTSLSALMSVLRILFLNYHRTQRDAAKLKVTSC